MKLPERTKMFMRKAATFTALGVMLAGVNAAPVNAASSVSGSLGGFQCRGTIATYSDKAIANTSFARGNSVIKAEGRVYYWSGKKYYWKRSTVTVSCGTASAVAKKKRGGAEVVGGKGIHSVSFGAYSWGNVITTIGNLPSNPVSD